MSVALVQPVSACRPGAAAHHLTQLEQKYTGGGHHSCSQSPTFLL